MQNLGTFYKESGKFKDLYLRGDGSSSEANVTGLKPICPTRWLSRASAVKSVLKNYAEVLSAIEMRVKL